MAYNIERRVMLTQWIFNLSFAMLQSYTDPTQNSTIVYEKSKYFKISQIEQDGFSWAVVIATYEQTSSLQCVHKCNLNKRCVEVFITTKNVCLLLNGTGNKSLGDSGAIQKISKIPLPGRFQ